MIDPSVTPAPSHKLLSPEVDILLGAVPSRRFRHGFSVLVLALALILTAMLLARLLNGSTSPFYTFPIQRGTFTPSLTIHGVLHGGEDVNLIAMRHGTLVSLPVRNHRQIAAGQLVAVLDSSAQVRTLGIDASAMITASETKNRLEAGLQQARQKLDRFEMVWRRSHGLVPSLDEMALARTGVAQATSDFARAQAQYDEAMSLLALDRIDFSRSWVRSPVAGYLETCGVQVPQAVDVGQSLCTVSRHPHHLIVAALLSDAEHLSLRRGAMAQVMVDGFTEEEFPAQMNRIEAHHAGGWTAYFQFEQPKNSETVLPEPGISALVRINQVTREDVLLVPDLALAFTPNGKRNVPGVYVASGSGAPRFVPVAVGGDDGQNREVLSGDLKPGDRVIIGWRRQGGV